MTYRNKMGLALGVSLVAILGQNAFAQTATQSAALPVREVEEVIVTAQKRSERLIDVPVAVSVVSGSGLEDRAITDIRELTKLAPSLQFVGIQSSRNAGFRIRGIGTSGFNEGVNPTIGTVVDGVVLGRQSSGLADLIDLERVEILRGPQGTLFGASTTGGLVNIVTRGPTADTQIGLDLQAGSYGLAAARATISGTLVPEKVTGRLSGFVATEEGWIDNIVTGKSGNGRDEWGLRGKLDFQISSDFKLRLNADYRDRTSTCCVPTLRDFNGVSPAFIPTFGPVTPSSSNRTTTENLQTGEDLTEWGAGAEVTWDIGDLTLTSITSYRDWTLADRFDADLTPRTILHFETTGFPLNVVNADQFSQEIRLANASGNKFEWLIGGFYFVQNLDRPTRFRGTLFDPLVGAGIPESYREFDRRQLETKNVAAFASGSYDLTETTEVFGGIRYTQIDLEMSNFERPASTPFPLGALLGPPLFIPKAATSDEDVSGNIGLRYKPSRNITYYGSWTRGYKGPALDIELGGLTLAQLNARAGGDLNKALTIAPETVDALELGFKGVLLDQRLRLDATIFDSQFEDYQTSAFDSSFGRFVLQNAGDLHTRGAELSASLQATPSLSVYGNLGYVKATFESYTNAACYNGQAIAPGQCRLVGTSRVQDLTGKTINNAPEWSFNGGAEWKAAVGGDLELSFVLDASWRSDHSTNSNQDPIAFQDAFWLVDGSVSLGKASDQSWSLQAYVKNATDQDYSVVITNIPSATPTVSNGHMQWLGAPRTFGVQVRIRR
jgi:iron complex outermembrane recepter protein